MEQQVYEIYINGVKLPTPSEYDVNFEDLDAEGIRPITTGVLKRNRIRARVMKCELQWILKPLLDTHTIFSMLEPETFEATVYDNTKNKYVTKTFYCSKCGYSYVRTLNGIKAQAIKVNLVEV